MHHGADLPMVKELKYATRYLRAKWSKTINPRSGHQWILDMFRCLMYGIFRPFEATMQQAVNCQDALTSFLH